VTASTAGKRWRLRTALEVAAAGVLAASLLPFGSRAWWVLELASHFRVQYVAAAAVLAVVLGVRKQWLGCAAAAVSFAVSLPPLLPYVALATPAAATPAGAPVKVLTANVEFTNRSADRLLALVRAESPDVVVLVEYTPLWSTLVDELRRSHPNFLELPQERSTGIALFSRLPLDSVQRLPLGTQPAIEARVRSAAGSFTLVGVHLRSPTSGWRAGQRNWQYELLARYTERTPGPLIVTGDFNTTPYSPYFASWIERTGLTDSRRGRGLTFSWPAFLPIAGIPIDHCVVSKDFRVISERRLSGIGSDHYPILTVLALDPGAAAAPLPSGGSK
jgi:endonuclease/exonuclease/phosphatase (EEP) superfamily protein YafD